MTSAVTSTSPTCAPPPPANGQAPPLTLDTSNPFHILVYNTDEEFSASNQRGIW